LQLRKGTFKRHSHAVAAQLQRCCLAAASVYLGGVSIPKNDLQHTISVCSKVECKLQGWMQMLHVVWQKPTWEPPPGGARTLLEGRSVRMLPTFCSQETLAQ
jgi:hypothetical protein